MISWGDMRLKVLRVLDDVERSNPSWSDADLEDYGNEALARLAKHTALSQVYEQTLTADTPYIVLPDDLLDPGMVTLSYGGQLAVLRPAQVRAGQVLSTTSGAVGAYYWQPAGTLNFLRPAQSGRTVRIQYWGYYPRIPAEAALTMLLQIPRWMEEALKWRMLVAALAKPGAQKAILAQYLTKRDSGNPEQNSLVYLARFYERQYDTVISEHPAQDRASWETELA